MACHSEVVLLLLCFALYCIPNGRLRHYSEARQRILATRRQIIAHFQGLYSPALPVRTLVSCFFKLVCNFSKRHFVTHSSTHLRMYPVLAPYFKQFSRVCVCPRTASLGHFYLTYGVSILVEPWSGGELNSRSYRRFDSKCVFHVKPSFNFVLECSCERRISDIHWMKICSFQ